MTPERWEQIQELYHAARAQPASDRAQFLDSACADDRVLRREVQALLDQPVSTGDFMDFVGGPAPAQLSDVATSDLTGLQLGSYRVLSLLGRGGMGEVYRARDSKLGRDVAIKVLPARFTADAERLARFQSEARMLAALNHPHIGAIYGLEDANGLPALVLELVEGETLAERIQRGSIPAHDALAIARQIADALDAAHRKGIIHRDLKPANVKITKEQNVKVLDFGLAKAAGREMPSVQDVSQSPTMAVDATRVGTILGTAAYMSPEQARGLAVDTRTDIWAFGCVLYEMLAGRPAFARDTISDTIAAVLERDPDWAALPRATPKRIRLLLRRCLEKAASRRLSDIGDARAAIDAVRSHSLVSRIAWPVAAASVVALSVAVYMALARGRGATDNAAEQAQLQAVTLTTFPGEELYPSFSSDEKHVAFSWNGAKQDNFDIYVQMIGSGTPLQLTRDPKRDYNPVWSPDGRWIAFLRGDAQSLVSEVRLVPPLGGPERKVASIRVGEVITLPVLLSWCPDSRYLLVTDSQGVDQADALFALSLENGEKRQLTRPEPPAVGDSQPAVSPDGRFLVFRRNISAGLTGDLHVMSLSRNLEPVGQPVRLTLPALDANYPVWTPDSKEVLFSARERLWRVAVSPRAEPARLPFVGEDGIMAAVTRVASGSAATLAYVRSSVDTNIWRIDAAQIGARSATRPVIAISSTRQDGNPQLSPDGRRVAFASNRSGDAEIWLADLDGSNALQLTSMGAPATGTPRWAPDGETVTFNSNLEGHWDIYVVSASGGKPRRLTDHPANDAVPSFSYDGRWIYFNSNRSGESQIWKLPAVGGEAVQITHNTGYVALESPDGAYVYYTQTVAGPSPLWRLASSGGQPEKVVDGVIWRNFAVLERGIYYVDQESGTTRLQFYDFASRRSGTVTRDLGNIRYGLTASRDGRVVLYTRVDSDIDDLMLVENFR
jgi:Tol biopolymer transport system component